MMELLTALHRPRDFIYYNLIIIVVIIIKNVEDKSK
jgi:hypothetical protein